MKKLNLIEERGTVLIIVMWISFGLVSLALFFGHSMMYEYRAADNTASGLEASQAVDGAREYVMYSLENSETPGMMLDAETFVSEQVGIGNASFWIIGRGDNAVDTGGSPVFGLIDEASKLNLNTASYEMLELLPGMTSELAAAIIDWRDEDMDLTPGGAESEDYMLEDPSYYCKDSRFETVEEMNLVLGAELGLLYGIDSNRNGVVEAYENDLTGVTQVSTSIRRFSSTTPLDSYGILEYLTIYSREPKKQKDGTARINIENAEELSPLLGEILGSEKAGEIIRSASDSGSILEFYLKSGMTPDEFIQVEDILFAGDEEFVEGLVNINTAPPEVLACLPGIGEEFAGALVSYRQGKAIEDLKSFTWVTEVLEPENIVQAGPFITSRSYQFSADIAAVGHDGHGFKRELLIFDATEIDSEGTVTPKVIYRQDRTRLGWPLGSEIRRELDSTDSMLVKRI